MARGATMNSQKNLVGVFLCLVCGLSCGGSGWPMPNKDFSEEDIRKQVDQALQLVEQPTFQGWKSEDIKQVVPKMHIGLVELWLQFRRFQKEQDEMWGRLRMLTTLSTEPCQELKDKVDELGKHVPERMDMFEKHMKTINMSMKSIEDMYKAESASRAHLHTTESGRQQEENQTCSQQSPHATCKLMSCTRNSTGRRKGKVSTTQLAHKVADLTELLNGHNELLVELYERVTALEGTQIRGHTSLKTPEGSGSIQHNVND